jgi:N6-adenosine-specific RNA methylase IME4
VKLTTKLELRKHPQIIDVATARHAIEKAKTIPEIKKIVDMASAAKIYAEKQRLALETQLDAAEIKTRAIHKAGQFLQKMEKHKGRPEKASPTGTLSEIGISRNESSRWQMVASVPERQLDKHIEKSRKDGRLTTSSVIKLARRKASKAPSLPPGKFAAIYADPPWLYSNTGFEQAAESHYAGRSAEDLAALPIADRCAPDCVLALWVTTPMQREAMTILSGWGFSYKTKAYWLKPRAPGMGFWVRGRVEELWIATKGAPPLPDKPPANVITAPVRAHSQKPEEGYELIEAISRGPYLELFSPSIGSPVSSLETLGRSSRNNLNSESSKPTEGTAKGNIGLK